MTSRMTAGFDVDIVDVPRPLVTHNGLVNDPWLASPSSGERARFLTRTCVG
jgi:hypothetical protein